MAEKRRPYPRMMTHGERLRDEGGFIHKSFVGKFVGGIAKKVIGSVPIVGGFAEGLIDQFTGVPGGAPVRGCPPGFISTPSGCVPRGRVDFRLTGPVTRGGGLRRLAGRPPPITGVSGIPIRGVPGREGFFPDPTPGQRELRRGLSLAEDPAAGVAVMGRFGAGFEPSVMMTDTRRCGRGAVLGVDGICYNKRDLRNDERFWPRGRRPLLTGGEMRAISTASSAAKKLQRKQKQLESLGLLKKAAPRSRRALPGHQEHLHHTGGSSHA